MIALSDLPEITYQGPPLVAYPRELPAELADLLLVTNGVVALGGGLHVRGLVQEPRWHSLDAAMVGVDSLGERYDNVRPHTIPFAQDCVGDQFLLDGGRVLRLSAETGDVSEFASNLPEFFEGVTADPLEYLSLHPLVTFQRDGGRLQPGQLIDVFPPYCAAESKFGVSMRAVPASARIDFLSSLSAQLRGARDGERVRFRVAD